MRRRLTALCLCLGLCLAAILPAGAEDAPIEVVVKDPYIDLHTGPGRGFPVTVSIERGVTIQLVRQRTDWVAVRTARGQQGWVHRSQLAQTLATDGRPVVIAGPGPDARTDHRWEIGVATGEFGGANVVQLNGAYLMGSTLMVRADVSQLIGTSSNGGLATLGLAHAFAPQWPISPIIGVGVGALHVSPKATLIDTRDRNDTVAYASIGARGYLSDRFLLQAEYRAFVVFTDRDDNEENDAWTIGFTYFF